MMRLEELRKKYKNIYVFGAGLYAHFFAGLLKKVRLSRYVDAFIVTSLENNPSFIRDVPVMTLDEVQKKISSIVIMAVDKDISEEIEKLLKTAKYQDIVHISALMDARDMYIARRRFSVQSNSFDVLWARVRNDLIYKYKAEKKEKYMDDIYQDELNKLRSRFHHVRILQVSILNVGPLAMSYALLQILMKRKQKDEKYILLSYNGNRPIYSLNDKDISNRFIYNRIISSVESVNEQTVAFWGYVIQHDKENFITMDVLCHPSADSCLFHRERIFHQKSNPYQSETYLHFDDNEEKMGKEILEKNGLKQSQYVCVFSRNNEYHEEYFQDSYTQYAYISSKRNSEIIDFLPACELLGEYGLKCVRVGALDQRKVIGSNIVDYTNTFRDEFMDFYLMGKAKFFLGDPSGINLIPFLSNVPMGITNNLTLIWRADEVINHNTGKVYTIYKKWWDKRKQRYWTLSEILEFQGNYGLTGEEEIELLDSMGIEFHSNTAEEIREFAFELNQRINGVWLEDDEMVKLREKFWDAVNDTLQFCRDENHLLYYEPGSLFLKRNAQIFNL